jgi:hypothetical protein
MGFSGSSPEGWSGVYVWDRPSVTRIILTFVETNAILRILQS